MDILRVLAAPDLEVRKKTLELALDLVLARNANEVVQYLKKELAKTESTEKFEKTAEYRQLLVRAMHGLSVRFPEIAEETVPQLLDFLSDASAAGNHYSGSPPINHRQTRLWMSFCLFERPSSVCHSSAATFWRSFATRFHRSLAAKFAALLFGFLGNIQRQKHRCKRLLNASCIDPNFADSGLTCSQDINWPLAYC